MATCSTRASSKAAQAEEASIPSQVQAPLPLYSSSHAGLDAGFVWQQLSEIQKTLGGIDAKLEQSQKQNANHVTRLESNIAEVKGELGKIKSDVGEFKQIRHTAKVVLWIVGAILALLGFFAKEAWYLLKPIAAEKIQQPSPGASKP